MLYNIYMLVHSHFRCKVTTNNWTMQTFCKKNSLCTHKWCFFAKGLSFAQSCGRNFEVGASAVGALEVTYSQIYLLFFAKFFFCLHIQKKSCTFAR